MNKETNLYSVAFKVWGAPMPEATHVVAADRLSHAVVIAAAQLMPIGSPELDSVMINIDGAWKFVNEADFLQVARWFNHAPAV